MIQYHNNYPIFTSISNKLDLPSVHFLIKFLYPIIMDKFSKDDGYKQDDLTSRHLYYNIFSIRQACIYNLYKFIIVSVKKFLQETNTSYDNLYIQAWENLTTKNQKILRHKHSNTFLNGHIAINAEPSSTIYSIDGDSSNVDIINQNGQIVITESDLSHSTSIWELDEPRTTIAFEVVRNIKNHHEIAFSNFHPLYLE